MSRPSALTRFFRLFIALLHLSVIGAAEIAEARLLTEERFVTHIESETFDCPFNAHGDHCAICQFLLATPDSDGNATSLPFNVLESAPAAHCYEAPLPHPAPAGQALPRAPPVLLT